MTSSERVRVDLWAAAAIIMLAGAPSSLAAQTEEVRLFLTAVDAEGHTVTTLTADQIAIIEDGERRTPKEVRPLDAPLRISVLVDNGRETRRILPDIRRGVVALLEGLPDGADVELVTFGGRPRGVGRRTTDRAALIEAANDIGLEREGGKYVDALTEALEQYERMDPEPLFWPVLVVVAADGVEASNVRDYDPALQRINEGFFRLEATVHTLLLRLTAVDTVELQSEIGQLLATNTHGTYEEASLGPDIIEKLRALGAEVATRYRQQSQQYVVVYERPQDAEPTRSRLETRGLSDVQISVSSSGRVR